MADVALFNLPVVSLEAAGFSSRAAAAFNLPVLTLTASGITTPAAVAEFDLPILTLSVASVQNGLGNATLDLPLLRFTLQGATGNLGTAAFSLPMLTLSTTAFQSGFATSTFALPVLYLSAQGVLPASSEYRTWALNLRKGAVTEYDGFDFNSYALFNGNILACGESGVVILGTQNLDNAAQIDATVRTGMADFDTTVHKRVPRLYVDGSQGGDLHFKAITVEGGTRTYLLPWNNMSGHTQRRVPVGKGPRSRFWQFGIDNVAGADFSTMALLVYPQKLRRRVS